MNNIMKLSWNLCGIFFIKTMEIYRVSCKKYTSNKNSSFRKTKQNRLMILSNCAVCGKKNSTFIKIKNFQIINVKWIKLLTNFYWIERNLCQNSI